MVCRRNFRTGDRVWGRKCLLHFVQWYCKEGVVYEYCSIDEVEGVFRRKTGDVFEDFLMVTGLTICVNGIDSVSQLVFNPNQAGGGGRFRPPYQFSSILTHFK